MTRIGIPRFDEFPRQTLPPPILWQSPLHVVRGGHQVEGIGHLQQERLRTDGPPGASVSALAWLAAASRSV